MTQHKMYSKCLIFAETWWALGQRLPCSLQLKVFFIADFFSHLYAANENI
jgi:hypothetical protein